MKAAIIGKTASGKTTHLIKKIIPLINNFIFFDFLHEHILGSNFKRFEKNLIGKELKSKVVNDIKSIDNNKIIIIDNVELLYFPSGEDKGFEWLKKELVNKKYILVFSSIERMSSGNISDIFDEIYLFPTRDDKYIRDSYIDWQISEGTVINEIM